MKDVYCKLLPETPGQLGVHTVLDESLHPPKVESLHFEFDGWLGDELIECFPCFLVTENLQRELQLSDFTGFVFRDAEISFSQTFKDLYPDREMPEFYWLVITGKDGDDFVISDNYLYVSLNAFYFLRQRGRMDHCEVEK